MLGINRLLQTVSLLFFVSEEAYAAAEIYLPTIFSSSGLSKPTQHRITPARPATTASQITTSADTAATPHTVASPEYRCVDGQGEFKKDFSSSSDNAKGACKAKCDATPGCQSFDFTSAIQVNACRLYGHNTPRLGRSGTGGRQYCRPRADGDDGDDRDDVIKSRYAASALATVASGTSETATIIALAMGYDLAAHQRFVGSLRYFGYQGNIILGVAPAMDPRHQEFLDRHNVQTHVVQVVPCKYPEDFVKRGTCALCKCSVPYPTLNMEIGRFALARDWLAACDRCTGPALFSDYRDLYFQGDPFEGVKISGVLLYEEHQLISTGHWIARYPSLEKIDAGICDRNVRFPWERRMLNSGTLIGDRLSLIRFLGAVVSDYMRVMHSINGSNCYRVRDMAVVNYLYYSGKAPYARAVPHRTGLVNTVGAEGAVLFQRHIEKYEALGHDRSYASQQPYEGSDGEDAWIGPSFNLIDKSGYLTNYDGMRSKVVHQFDRLGYPFIRRWLNHQPFMTELYPTPVRSWQGTKLVKVHLWDDTTYFKPRETMFNQEGWGGHPRVSLVSDPAEADLVVWVTTQTKVEAEVAPRGYPHVAVLDYADGVTLHRQVVRGNLSGSKVVYFKRSWTVRSQGEFLRFALPMMDGVPVPLKTKPETRIFPIAYSGHSGLLDPSPEESDRARSVSISCSLRVRGRSNINRYKIRNWTQDFVDLHNVTDAYIGQAGQGRSMAGWDGNFMKLLRRSRIVVTSNPSSWEGDFRLWETLLAGPLVLIDKMTVPGLLPEPLRHGEHFVMYDPTNKTELHDLLLYYWTHPEEAAAIGKAGRERVLNSHMPVNRAEYVLQTIPEFALRTG
ncbi:hypothetical protein CYMTET_40522 [Cymbomonas tetramitiformis]|uniref:Spore protein YkvP/CgeB glycosyl transferase-like domain-containing protein n=1 Tax=Cymbomonas tetramitiformis TaxID=36881 RepID=A0AAE0C9A5_9CHLO|nr:hypothetical protein CYMTET_40522 [Cymbomonas tetramitiformis]